MKIVFVAGARPNFIKIAPLMEAIKRRPAIEPMMVHTGQHYHETMSDLFFRQLGIPEPDVNLAKMGIKLIHVEAGLRSFDRSMPEEINRILTDSISDLLFCSEQSGVDNLRREGIPETKIHFVGNVMIDTLLRHQEKAEASNILPELGVRSGTYAVVTLHRPSNVDNAAVLSRIFSALGEIGRDMPVVFPIHPRTRQRLAAAGVEGNHSPIKLIDPLGYLDFLKLMSSARLVLTDSGGIQEETTILKVPCLTLRENTERPSTVEMGCNRLVGTEPNRILAAYQEIRNGGQRPAKTPPLWDGHAAERIVNVINSL